MSPTQISPWWWILALLPVLGWVLPSFSSTDTHDPFERQALAAAEETRSASRSPRTTTHALLISTRVTDDTLTIGVTPEGQEMDRDQQYDRARRPLGSRPALASVAWT